MIYNGFILGAREGFGGGGGDSSMGWEQMTIAFVY